MKVTLDTHVLQWALSEPERLDDARRQLIADRPNAVFVRAVSAAEIAIRASIGKLAFAGDPFDRMLVCQALERALPVTTDDAMFERYGCGVV